MNWIYRIAPVLNLIFTLFHTILIIPYPTDLCKDSLYLKQNAIPNLGIVKEQITHYIESGCYEKDIASVARDVKEYLISLGPVKPTDTIIFDIDETALSNWSYYKKSNFAYHEESATRWEKTAQVPAIKPILELYKFAQKRGFSIFFISGRPCSLQEKTIENLHKVGFTGWKDIICRPDNYSLPSRVPFKTKARCAIEHQGYRIVATVGDQMSDLLGGYAGKTFKLPNPLYYIP